MSGKLGIVLVNFNSWRPTIECLASLRALDYPVVEVWVVDNASSDESCARIRKSAPEVHLLALAANMGFAGGCNAGMRAAVAAGCEFLWLLNNDTEVTPDSARLLVDLARSRWDHHFFGCLISLFDRPEVLWFGGGRFNRWTGTTSHVGFLQAARAYSGPFAVETDWVTGCSLLIRSSSLPAIGWLDEDFFLYKEDLEWQIRAGRGKPRALLLRANIVRHKVGQSTGSTDAPMGWAFMSRNFIKLAFRYSGATLPIWLASWATWHCMVPAMRGRWPLLRASLFGAFSQSIPGAEIVRRWRGGTR